MVSADSSSPSHEARVTVNNSAPHIPASATPNSTPFMLALRPSATNIPSASDAMSCSASA